MSPSPGGVKTPPCLRSRNSIAVCESPVYTTRGFSTLKPTAETQQHKTHNSTSTPLTTNKARSSLLQRGESLLKKLPPSLERRFRSQTDTSSPPVSIYHIQFIRTHFSCYSPTQHFLRYSLNKPILCFLLHSRLSSRILG